MTKQRLIVLLTAVALALALLPITYAGVALYWHQAQIAALSDKLQVRRGGVLVRPEQAESLHTLVTLVQGESDPGDALLTVPDLSMLNFLSERSMPSPDTPQPFGPYTLLRRLAAGGMVVPGYMALYANKPVDIGLTLLAALVTFAFLKGLSQIAIVYGRRRTALTIMIGYLVGSNHGRGFPTYVRNFNANFLALPALPSRILPTASGDDEVVVRRIESEQHGSWVAVVNTSLTQKPNVKITLPKGKVTDALEARSLE